jgi:hypothetical protein
MSDPTKEITGPYSHDLMVQVMMDLHPDLVSNVDYVCAHDFNEDDPSQHGDPYFLVWRRADIKAPDPADLKATFEADEDKYRSAFARRYRDACLAGTDGRANVTDAPPSSRLAAQVDAWRTFRQALRDVPQQAGFPMTIDWPKYPGE